MRLSAEARLTIVATARDYFGADVRVWLFGSRVSDQMQGGDLDLLVQSTGLSDNRPLLVARFIAALQSSLGDQKIDVVLLDPTSTPLPIHHVAKSTGLEITAMIDKNPDELRARSLLELCKREAEWLARSSRRLFSLPLDAEWVKRLNDDDAAAETLEAFVSRFARFQDTLGDKLLPVCLRLLAEKPSSVLDNLNRAEKLGFLWSAQEWLVARNLRNRMVHEYEVVPDQLVESLMAANVFVPRLLETYHLINQRLLAILPG